MAPGLKIEQMERDRDAIRAAAAASPVFLLTDEAGFYYLISGVKNPTSIDYPLVSSMGRNGETKMIQAIKASKTGFVCLKSHGEPLLRPARLESFVRSELQFINRLGFCDLYRLGPAGDEEATDVN
jgi:hypothetical protein